MSFSLRLFWLMLVGTLATGRPLFASLLMLATEFRDLPVSLLMLAIGWLLDIRSLLILLSIRRDSVIPAFLFCVYGVREVLPRHRK